MDSTQPSKEDDFTQLVQNAALLHTLATHPERVVLPGKSLRSGLLSKREKWEAPSWEPEEKCVETRFAKRVHDTMHDAFWDKTVETLKDPKASVHLPRLEGLYHDLHSYVKGILPRSSPILVTLQAPLSPTPNALLTARNQLSQLVSALLTQCAPIRDEKLQETLGLLKDETKETLPERIVGALKNLFDVAMLMKSDLSVTMLGGVSDEKLEREILKAAREKEREAVEKVFGLKSVCWRWKEWLRRDGLDQQDWTRRLWDALGADVVVSCPLPPDHETTKNALPPIFLFTIPDLVRLQNYLQALVIAAVLRTLVPMRTPLAAASLSQASPPEYVDVADRTFTDRVLSLLSSEVDDIVANPSHPTQTKLAHLIDEVDRERRAQGVPPPIPIPTSTTHTHPPTTSSTPLPSLSTHTKVTALLHPTHPVFILLRARLLAALAYATTALLADYKRTVDDTFTGRTRVPAPRVMMTGRDRKRVRVDIGIAGDVDTAGGGGRGGGGVNGTHQVESTAYAQPKAVGAFKRYVLERVQEQGQPRLLAAAKGYEDPVLKRGIEKALGELADVVEWVRDTWGGLGLEGVDEGEGWERKVKSPSSSTSD